MLNLRLKLRLKLRHTSGTQFAEEFQGWIKTKIRPKLSEIKRRAADPMIIAFPLASSLAVSSVSALSLVDN